MFSWLPYFSLKLFGFSCIRLLIFFSVISSHLLVEFSFVVLECPVLFVLSYPLSISLKSSFFRHYFHVYFLKLYCYFFLCCLILFFSICSSVFPLFYHFGRFSDIFYLSFQSNFPSWFWFFSSCFLRGSQFSHKLISSLHISVHLIRLYYSLIYKFVLDFFFPFPFWPFSILCFLVMVR